jgi:hypothetical protein
MEPRQGVAVQQRLEFPLEDITNDLFDIIVFQGISSKEPGS